MRKSFHGMMFAAVAVAFQSMRFAVEAVGRLVSGSVYWLVEHFSAPAILKVAQERWDADERLYSQRSQHRLNIFSQDARSTGALCSPALA